MEKGWLVYDAVDLDKNKSFADYLISCGQALGLEMTLVTRQSIMLGVEGISLFMKCEEPHSRPSFIMNRSRDVRLSIQCEQMGIPVFNSALVTRLGNDKLEAHQFVGAQGVPVVKTYFYDRHFCPDLPKDLTYPVVMKTINGHGGEEVYKLLTKEAVDEKIKEKNCENYVLQELCSQVGVDVRVFCVKNEIVACVKRKSSTNFKSNYSLGGTIELITPDESLVNEVKKITQALACDCVGIDFLIDANGHYLFNEIEDAVGCRSLYQLSDIDLAVCYMEHIKKTLNL